MTTNYNKDKKQLNLVGTGNQCRLQRTLGVVI